MHALLAMVGSRKGPNLALAILMCGVGGMFACSAPPPQKTAIVVCEAGEDGCPSEKPKTAKQHTQKRDDDDGPTGFPAPPASTSDEDVDEDEDETPAEPEPEEPVTGPICTKLKSCCGQLKAAGYSDATCLEIVGTGSETACSLQHKQYKDFGDCT